jgi:hypothetical protein
VAVDLSQPNLAFSSSRRIPARPAAYNGLPDDPAIPADQPDLAHPATTPFPADARTKPERLALSVLRGPVSRETGPLLSTVQDEFAVAGEEVARRPTWSASDLGFRFSRGIPGRPAAYNGLPDDPAIPADCRQIDQPLASFPPSPHIHQLGQPQQGHSPPTRPHNY